MKKLISKFKSKAIGIIKPFIIAMFLLGIVSCNTKEKFSDKIVLKIGNLAITKYEFEKNKNRFEKSNPNTDKQKLKKWIDEYIDETYILADAFEKKYDTIESLNKTLNYEFNDKVAEVDGYVWNKVESPKFDITRVELKETYKMRNKAFMVSILYFPNIEVLNRYLHNKEVSTVAEFDQLIELTKNNKEVQYLNQSIFWPFNPLGMYKDKIKSLTAGNVIGPLESLNGYYILNLNKIEEVNQHPFNKEKQAINWEIVLERKNKIIYDKQKQIFEKTEVAFNENAIDNLSGILQKVKIDSIPDDYKDKLLMTFKLNGSTNVFKVDDFKDYLTHKALIPDNYNQTEIIKEYLKNYVISKYLYCVADTLGILRDKWVLLDKRYFQNNLIKSYYSEHEFLNNISINDNEISDYYLKNKESFTDSKIMTVSFLEFRNLDYAKYNLPVISQILNEGKFFNLKDTSIIKGLISYKPNQMIESTCKDYPQEVIDNILSIRENQLSMPFKNKDKYLVFFITKREGARIRDMREVKNQISLILGNKKFIELKNKRISELKKKYNMFTNIL